MHPVTNIILSYLMIARILFGLFRFVLSLRRFLPSCIFFSYVRTQFGVTVKSVQCDNGREFDNSSTRTFFLSNGVLLRMSCPYTSQQNGRAERALRTINNILRSLLFHASLPPVYWVEALHTATYILNRQPTKTLGNSTPFFRFIRHTPNLYSSPCVRLCVLPKLVIYSPT